jgi:hypothetical protein
VLYFGYYNRNTEEVIEIPVGPPIRSTVLREGSTLARPFRSISPALVRAR